MRSVREGSGATAMPPEVERESRAMITRLLAEIRAELHEGANLASVAAMSRNDMLQPASSGDARSRILRLFDMIQGGDKLLERVNSDVATLADSIDRDQQLLAVALQSRSMTISDGPLIFEPERGQTVVKSRLYWMPYTLHFES